MYETSGARREKWGAGWPGGALRFPQIPWAGSGDTFRDKRGLSGLEPRGASLEQAPLCDPGHIPGALGLQRKGLGASGGLRYPCSGCRSWKLSNHSPTCFPLRVEEVSCQVGSCDGNELGEPGHGQDSPCSGQVSRGAEGWHLGDLDARDAKKENKFNSGDPPPSILLVTSSYFNFVRVPLALFCSSGGSTAH